MGTGFVVHEKGLIATNDHVVDAIGKLPHPTDFDEIPAVALFFILTDQGMMQLDLSIQGIFKLTDFKPGLAYYGPSKPDIAFVQLDVSGLLPVKIRAHDHFFEEGELVATAGFPMGTDQLAAPGWLHQISPTLQAGIISAVHPFPCKTPHGFTINVMVQGGANGSPVFSPETGEVLGIVYAGLHDIETDEKSQQWRTSTNYAFALPSHFIASSVRKILESKTTEELHDRLKLITVIEGRVAINALNGDKMIRPKLPW